MMTILELETGPGAGGRRGHLRDPRNLQIAILSSLLAYGLGWFGLDTEAITIGVMVGCAVGCQLICSRLYRLARFDPKSALISGLSLGLLARTDSLGIAALIAVIAIVSKFVIRVRNRHVFNPTNFALVAMMSASDRVWVSPGQWGSEALLGFFFASLGALVVSRAQRSDVTIAFLLAYGGMLVGRAVWLGDPLAIPMHQLQSGTLLIFAFLMISDPKTTPESRGGRIVFAVGLAGVAMFLRFGLVATNSLLWALVVCSPLTPVINAILPGRPYQWDAVPSPRATTQPTASPRPAAAQSPS